MLTSRRPLPVNEVDRWFERTARDSRHPVTLYPSLLTGRIFGYLRYRLRYPLLIATVRFAVHVAEFFILLSSLGGVAAYTVMMLRAGSLFVSGGWWGLLEVMRERLRTFARSGQRDASESEIGRWLVLATVLAVATTVAGGVVLLMFTQIADDVIRNGVRVVVDLWRVFRISGRRDVLVVPGQRRGIEE